MLAHEMKNIYDDDDCILEMTKIFLKSVLLSLKTLTF